MLQRKRLQFIFINFTRMLFEILIGQTMRDNNEINESLK